MKELFKKTIFLFLLISFAGSLVVVAQYSKPEKPRIIVTTDGEIGDECSMVRFLLCANEFDIKGIVTTSSQYHWQGHEWASDEWIDPYLNAYEEVYPNLVKHDPNFPTPSFLRKKTRMGNMSEEGEMDKLTEGSQLIVNVLLDETDARPIWLQAWGDWWGLERAVTMPKYESEYRELAQFVHDIDPYHHHLVIHNGEDFDPLYGPDFKLTGASLQTTEEDFRKAPNKKDNDWVVVLKNSKT